MFEVPDTAMAQMILQNQQSQQKQKTDNRNKLLVILGWVVGIIILIKILFK